MEINQQVATQTALEEKNQELEKAVLDMANRAAGENPRPTRRKGKLKKLRVLATTTKKEMYPKRPMTVMRRMMVLTIH